MNTFDKIFSQYEQKSLVQQKAAVKLRDLLKITGTEDIIDVACGPGHITSQLRKLTNGRVIGIDISKNMINQAKALYPEIEFRQLDAEVLEYRNEFDIVFCNSALQWFSNPDKSIQSIFNSLKMPGKLGLANPATDDWSPWLSRIMSQVEMDKEIKPIFTHWKNPWFFLPTKNDYKMLFEKHGFTTIFIEIDYEQTEYTTEKAYDIYLSGAANGYTGKKYYDIEISDDFISLFNKKVKEEIERQSVEGKSMVDFNRMYYIGKK